MSEICYVPKDKLNLLDPDQARYVRIIGVSFQIVFDLNRTEREFFRYGSMVYALML